MASNSHNPNISRDPDVLLSFRFIPPHLMRYIPHDRKPGPATEKQRVAIKSILNMRSEQPFNRCRGEKKDGTRCQSVAGYRTKGDFYGLGVETGILGVGFCARCILHHHMKAGIVLVNAQREVEMMQKYGSVDRSDEYSLKVAKEEGELAVARVKARDEFDMVVRELHKLAKDLDGEKKPQIYVNGGKDAGMVLQDVDDKTLFDMRMEAAKTLSKLRLDDLKLDSTKYVQTDLVMGLLVEASQAVRSAIALAEELTVAKQVRGEQIETDRPIRDYVFEKFSIEWSTICNRLKVLSGKK